MEMSSDQLRALISVRRFPWRVIWLLFTLDLLLVTVVNGWFGAQDWWLREFEFLGGVIQGDLLINLAIIGVILLPAFFLAGVRWADMGLDSFRPREGLIFTLLCFNLCLVLVPLFSLIYGQTLDWGVRWNLFWVGKVITLAVGVALTEELLYRGFLLRQMYQRFPRWTHQSRLAFGLVTSQLMFACVHIPTRLAANTPLERLPLELFILFSMGLMFSFVYLRTRSLAAAIGAHFLFDFVAGLPGAPILPVLTVELTMMLVIVIWKYLPLGRLEFFARPRVIPVRDTLH